MFVELIKEKVAIISELANLKMELCSHIDG